MDNFRLFAAVMLYSILANNFKYFCEVFLKKLAVILFSGFLFTYANASNWVQVHSDLEQKRYVYVDIESISVQGEYKQVLSKRIAIEDKIYFIVFNSYDCKSNPMRVKTTYFTSYNLDGSVRYSGSKSNFFEPLSPGTASKLEADFVCNF